MRSTLALLLASLASVFLLASSSLWFTAISSSEGAHARAWCAHYADRSTAMVCAFSSHEQCLTDIRGRGGFCLENLAHLGRLRHPGA
jgi:hypothetical protein